jgi:hypothetical protein
MDNKFWQWIALQEEFARHSENAHTALMAIELNDKIVNRHLLRIARREGDLAEFADCLSASPVFDRLFEEEL